MEVDFSYLGACRFIPGNLSWQGLQGLGKGEACCPGNIHRASATELQALSSMLTRTVQGLYGPWSLWGLSLAPGPAEPRPPTGCHYIVQAQLENKIRTKQFLKKLTMTSATWWALQAKEVLGCGLPLALPQAITVTEHLLCVKHCTRCDLYILSTWCSQQKQQYGIGSTMISIPQKKTLELREVNWLFQGL